MINFITPFWKKTIFVNYSITFWDNLFDKDRGLVIKISDELDILLIMKGKKIGYVLQVATKEELGTCEHVVIESPEPW